MSVYKEKRTGSWCYKFIKNGVQYHKCFKGISKDEVIAYEADLRTRIERGERNFTDKKKKTKMLSEIRLEYTSYCETNYTNPNQFNHVIQAFYNLIGNKQVSLITPADVEHYKTLRSGVVANSSINRELNNISKMFSLAVDNGYIAFNPCSAVKKLREERVVERFLSRDEELKLLNECSPVLRLLIIAALHTGARCGELLNLKWQHIDFIKNYLVLYKTKNNIERRIPLSKRLKDELYNFPRISDYVFTNPRTKTRYMYARKAFEGAVRRAGIAGLTFHHLRHSAATRMVEFGIDLVVVKELLGHALLTTTQRYAHPVPRRMLA